MKSLWDEGEAKIFAEDPLQLRVYTSRLLGQEPGLVLHGGGNTSVKTEVTNVWGEKEEILFIKGSGCDLKSIQANDFSPVRLKVLQRMVGLDQLSDREMARLQRSALTDFSAPNPSLEAILHAIIPFKFVDHSHSNEVVTITNNERGEALIRDIYKDRVLAVSYVKAGFKLAKAVYKIIRKIDWEKIDGLILMNHGVFTFSDDARTSYEQMIHIASLAQDYLRKHGASIMVQKTEPKEDLLTLSQIRHQVSLVRGAPMVAKLDQSPEARGFVNLSNVDSIATRGPITADHIIRTKAIPVILRNNIKNEIDRFVSAYKKYFNTYTDGQLTMLDPAPRWAVWPPYGTIAFGTNLKEVEIVSDIIQHTICAIQHGEAIGGWKPLSEKHIFEMEYWELQQAKLKKDRRSLELQGKIALVTGAASGIGYACAEALHEKGAAIIGLDLDPECALMFNQQDAMGVTCNVTDEKYVRQTVDMTVRQFGGLDILVSNAGIFTANQKIEDMDEAAWRQSMEINLSSHQQLLKICIPYLKRGIEPAIVFIASKNVPAPGPGAAAYSVAKAGMTQLARIAAMELGADGVRVNVVHPDAVYDTALWTPEVLKSRARHYGLTVEEYKTKNILRTEVTSKDVAALVCAMIGPAFAKTTGAQIPIDGGNERVI
jgi:rhamnose utilization protein RhaD (predicted bifunctional aldolase and dehydrogenase)/NAD(P)-dependent dehydrogenase (short-subunit alcohol dehydrogenase family)